MNTTGTSKNQLPFQRRVVDWMMETFSMEVCRDTTERNHRFLEESLELVQAMGCTQSEAHMLVDYVYGRPTGEPEQEVGGAMVTLAALCSAADFSMAACGDRELDRCWLNIDKIRAKQAGKPKHSPLPERSAVETTQPEPSKPVLGVRVHGELGPSDVIVDAADLLKWSREVEAWLRAGGETSAPPATYVAAYGSKFNFSLVKQGTFWPNDMGGLLSAIAQILDVVKGEWGELWSEFGQDTRNALTAYLLALWPPEKPSGCPTHGLEHFFEGMCIQCGVVPAEKTEAPHGIQRAIVETSDIDQVLPVHQLGQNTALNLRAEASGDRQALSEETSDSYRDAFYAIADLIGLTAMPISPKEAFETRMLPRLRELVERQPEKTTP